MTVYYVQNDDLDRCCLLQNFGFLIPVPEGWDADTTPSFYQKKKDLGKWLRHWGITHDYFPPPGKVVSLNEFKEGYGVADRYDVGEFNQQDGIRTKYGYKQDLLNCLEMNSYYSVNNMVDLVPNQMFLGSQRVCSAYLSDNNGNRMSHANFLYPAYIDSLPINGNPNECQGQEKYGSCELTGWQINGGAPHAVGMYSILSDGYLPYVWNFPGINITVAYEGNIPSWYVDWDTKKTNSDGTYTVISTNGEIQYTYDSSILNGYHWGYNLHGGGQVTCRVNYMNGSYVPPWFLKQVLFWGLNGWTYNSQVVPDMYGINNYLTILCGFVQYVHFIPYAYYYDDPVPGSQTESFKDYVGNRGFQTEDSVINNVGSAISGMISDWAGQQPGYSTTDDFLNFTIDKSIFTSYPWWWARKYLNIYPTYNNSGGVNREGIDLTKIYPRGNDISCNAGTGIPDNSYGSLQSIFSIPTDPNGENWNDLYSMFGETHEDVINSLINSFTSYQGINELWSIEDYEKYPAYNKYVAMEKAQGWASVFGTNPDRETGAGVHLMSGNEMLLGTDMDNFNPVLQKDTINWENFLFDLGFNSFRIDAPMCFAYDILTQCSENMESRFGLENMRNGTNLTVNESYSTKDMAWQSNHGYCQLTMDYQQRTNYGPLISARGWPSENLSDIVMTLNYGVNNRNGSLPSSEPCPSWTFVDNHDTRKGQILSYLEPHDQQLFADAGTWEMVKIMCDAYYLDYGKVDKGRSWTNMIPVYAVLLSMSNVTPSVYFGDLYQEHTEYWKDRTYYYGYLTTILTARSRYAFGEYQFQTFVGKESNIPGHDIIANVRFGVNRLTGWAVVVGNNPYNEVTIKLSMGLLHKNQKYKNLCEPYSMEETTDENGFLSIVTTGEMSANVWGHLSIWVPASLEEEI